MLVGLGRVGVVGVVEFDQLSHPPLSPSPPTHRQATMTMGAGLFGASLGIFVKMASNSMRKIPLRRGKGLSVFEWGGGVRIGGT